MLVFGVVLLAWFHARCPPRPDPGPRARVAATPRIRRPFVAIAVFNGIFVLTWLSSAGLAWLREQIGVGALLGTLLTLLLTTAIALFAMWLLPNRATHPRELLPGAALVALGGVLGQIAVVFYFAPRLGRSKRTTAHSARLRPLLMALRDLPPDHECRLPQFDALDEAAGRDDEAGPP